MDADEELFKNLTADQRRFTQIRIGRFHRRDAKYAEVRIFAQSGDDDWAKPKGFKGDMFLFVVVSRQTKKEILCVSAVNYYLR